MRPSDARGREDFWEVHWDLAGVSATSALRIKPRVHEGMLHAGHKEECR